MKINNIIIQNDGYVYCKSCFYTCDDILPTDKAYTFSVGTNKLVGEIDSGNWAVSYLLSMYKHRPQDFVLYGEPTLTINGKMISLNEASEHTCYMDEKFYPLFSSSKSVKELIEDGIKHTKSDYTYDKIKEIFDLDSERTARPISSVGNERFRAMAAVGIAYGKEIFCFPWLSNKRFEGYHKNLSGLLEILASLGKISILPIGAPTKQEDN